MNLFFPLIVSFFSGFLVMELVAWAAHKYVMHGPLWFIHRDHHNPGTTFFQRNDLFFLIFATPSWLSIQGGLESQIYPLASFGFGILAYGIAYVLVHEVMIHRRFTFFKAPKSRYWQRVLRQHQKHHQSPKKEGGVFFGMLWPSSDS